MHPSVYAADADNRGRRVATKSPCKREQSASCSSATPSMTYQIPSLSGLERRSSCTSSSVACSPPSSKDSTHSMEERRSSCSSTASLSDSYSTHSSYSSKKSCSFFEEVEVIHLPAATSMTSESLWYQREDFDNFRKKTQRIINNVDENGRGKNGKKYCTLGLEKYMARALESRKSILGALDGDSSHKSSEMQQNIPERPVSFRRCSIQNKTTEPERPVSFRRRSIQNKTTEPDRPASFRRRSIQNKTTEPPQRPVSFRRRSIQNKTAEPEKPVSFNKRSIQTKTTEPEKPVSFRKRFPWSRKPME